jgi:tetratricopeptide (TPR) repeat protein
MEYPNRHNSHILENKSEIFFKQFIPPEWVLNKYQIDYGLDYNCEIVEKNQVIGVNFSIQLKAKKQERNKGFVIINNLKRGTIKRWKNRLEPIMIIVYIEKDNCAYWDWIYENTFDLIKTNNYYQIKINKKNRLNKIDWQEIENYVKRVFANKNSLHDFPLKTDNIMLNDAWRFYFNRKFEKALIMFKEFKTNGKSIEVLNAIALCEYELYHYQEALISINKAIGIKKIPILLLNKASILTECGDLSKNEKYLLLAKEIFEELLKNEKNSVLYYNYANCLKSLKKYKLARDYYKKSIQLNPNNDQGWKNLGSTYFELGEHLLEIKCYDNALKLNPKLSEALFSKGNTILNIYGDANTGLRLMLKAIRINRDNKYEIAFPYVYFWIAEAYFSLGKYKIAVKWNEKGLNLNPIDEYFIKQKERFLGK